MTLAELKGKISSKIENSEDLLVSDVFSVIKNADRKTVLNSFLSLVNVKIKETELEKVEFRFWNKYEDGTEPDIIIVTDSYYILIEAKYKSKLGSDESQLIREVKSAFEEKNDNQRLYLICVTDDVLEPKEAIGDLVRETNLQNVYWIGWRKINDLFKKLLMVPKLDEISKRLVSEVVELLEKKNLVYFDKFEEENYLNVVNLKKEQEKLYKKVELFARNLVEELSNTGIGISHKELESDKPLIRNGCSKAMFKSENWVTDYICLPFWDKKWDKKKNSRWDNAYLYVEFRFDDHFEIQTKIGYFFYLKKKRPEKDQIIKLLEFLKNEEGMKLAISTNEEDLFWENNEIKIKEVIKDLEGAESFEFFYSYPINKLTIELTKEKLAYFRDIINKFNFLTDVGR